MKTVKLFEEFVNESFYDIEVNKLDLETISDADIKDYIEDGYTSLTGIIDQFLQLAGYDFDDMQDWGWANRNDVKTITRKFKIKE